MGQMSMDISNDILNMLQHIVVPIPNHTITMLLQHVSPLRIIARRLRVLATVDFDHQPRLWAQKVGDVAMKWHLSTETEAFELSAAQAPP